MKVRIQRRQRAVLPPRGVFRAGAGEVDVTPHLGLPLAGYSLDGMHAIGARGHLYARALYLEDARGEPVAFVVLDAHSATRALLEQAASLTASFGIGVERLVLSGTHTHTAPGRFYGNTLYDAFAQCETGFDPRYVGWLATKIVEAITIARRRAKPAAIGVARTTLFGVTRNRSLVPHRRNPESARWNDPGFPGENAPAALRPDQRAVDPRVHVVAAVSAGKVLASFASFACHATALGPHEGVMSPDFPGVAVRTARRALGGVVVALGSSASGDVTPLPITGAQGYEVAHRVGVAVGQAIVDATRLAATRATERTIDVRYAEPSVPSAIVGQREDTRLAERFFFGAPTLGGSEESRTALHRLGVVREGMTSTQFRASDPQHPKAPAVGLLHGLLGGALELAPGAVFPLHYVRLGDDVIATVPGEPTSVAAFRIERALLRATGAATVRVLGYSGDYGGYVTTEEEYRAQHYEGASTLFGRNVARHLEGRLVALAQSEPQAPLPARTLTLAAGDEVRAFAVESGKGAHRAPLVQRTGDRVEIKLRFPKSARIVLAEGALVSIEERSGRALTIAGEPYDDAHEDFSIVREDESGVYTVTLVLPTSLASKPLRARVRAVGRIPGIVVAIPSE